VLAGEISNDEFAAILTGSPVVDDPGGSEQALARVFSASVSTTASYAYSRRVSLNFGAGSSLNQLIGNNIRRGDSALPYLSFARTTSANASADYRLSSRTRVGVRHITSFSQSSYLHSVSHNPSL